MDTLTLEYTGYTNNQAAHTAPKLLKVATHNLSQSQIEQSRCMSLCLTIDGAGTKVLFKGLVGL